MIASINIFQTFELAAPGFGTEVQKKISFNLIEI